MPNAAVHCPGNNSRDGVRQNSISIFISQTRSRNVGTEIPGEGNGERYGGESLGVEVERGRGRIGDDNEGLFRDGGVANPPERIDERQLIRRVRVFAYLHFSSEIVRPRESVLLSSR